jgi:hypothetical protein
VRPILLHQHKNDYGMSKKETVKYEAKIDQFFDKKIIINVNHLDNGNYELNIINKNKLIVKTTFKKK